MEYGAEQKPSATDVIEVVDHGADLDADDEGWLGRRVEQQTLKPPSLLRWPSVVCIVANCMIGSGIFSSPSILMQLTQSVGISLLFWVAGAFATLCGALMFVEYALTSPRFSFYGHPQGVKLPLPRSGGELFYLKDVIRQPAFLAVSLYGIAFILFGNIATNSLAFGARVLEAAGRNDTEDTWEARGIAIATVILTCMLHSLWRIGGIRLNNILAVVKMLMLLLIFITGCLAWAGVFEKSEAVPNLTAPNAFSNPSSVAYAYGQAYLSIVFSYTGFNHANYVLSEVKQPKKHYKWPALLAVFGVSLLYLLVNIAYMLVVPAEEQKAGVDVATRFFELTYGSISPNGQETAHRILAAFVAVSTLGNIIVMTFTASRIKQEIAKEGILPCYNFLANNQVLFGAKDNPVPLGALVLHGGVSILLILATASITPLQAYHILMNVYIYTTECIFSIVLCIGIFILRSRRRNSSFPACSFLPGWLSRTVAAVYGCALTFPLVVSYIPPPGNTIPGAYPPAMPWYSIATLSWCSVALGAVWYVVFKWAYPRRHPGKQLVVERMLVISDEMTLEHETIKFEWLPGDQGVPAMREEGYIKGANNIASGPVGNLFV